MVTGPKGMAVMISQGVSGTAASLSLSDDGENYRVKANIILLEWSIFGRQKQNFKGWGIQIFSCRWSKHFQVDRSKIYVERRKQKFAGKQKQQFSGGQKKINSENTDYRFKNILVQMGPKKFRENMFWRRHQTYLEKQQNKISVMKGKLRSSRYGSQKAEWSTVIL